MHPKSQDFTPIPQKRPMKRIKNQVEAIFMMDRVAEMGIQ